MRVIAEDFADFLTNQEGEPRQAALALPDQGFQPGDWVLANIVTNANSNVREALRPQIAGFLETGGQETFAAFHSGGVRFLLGGGQRGVSYASVWTQDSWRGRGEDPLSSSGDSITRVPSFRIRLAGAGGTAPGGEAAQPRPPDFDWNSYARSLAHHSINLTPAEVDGEVVPDSALRPWGIRKVLFLSSAPFEESDLRKWRTSQPAQVHSTIRPRARSDDDEALCPCVSSSVGRRWYRERIEEALAQHGAASHIVFQFSGPGVIPPDSCGYGDEIWSRCLGFLKDIHPIVKDIAPEVRILGSLQGLAAQDCAEIIDHLPKGIGLFVEEPCQGVLDPPSEGFDATFLQNEWDKSYLDILSDEFKKSPDSFVFAVAAGDTDWTSSPAVGLPLPSISYSKVRRLGDLGIANVALAKGGFHPWAYSPNVEVFHHMVWNPDADFEPVIDEIASRDFGDAGPLVVKAWDSFDRAISAYPYMGRDQRLETLLEGQRSPVTSFYSPEQLGQNEGVRGLHDSVPFLLESIPALFEPWSQGLQLLWDAQEEASNGSFAIAENLRQQIFWATFYLRLVEVQHQTNRRLNLLRWMPEEADPEEEPWNRAFHMIYQDEVENCLEWENLLFNAPLPRIRVGGLIETPASLSRRFSQKRSILESKLQTRRR